MNTARFWEYVRPFFSIMHEITKLCQSIIFRQFFLKSKLFSPKKYCNYECEYLFLTKNWKINIGKLKIFPMQGEGFKFKTKKFSVRRDITRQEGVINQIRFSAYYLLYFNFSPRLIQVWTRVSRCFFCPHLVTIVLHISL